MEPGPPVGRMAHIFVVQFGIELIPVLCDHYVRVKFLFCPKEREEWNLEIWQLWSISIYLQIKPRLLSIEVTPMDNAPNQVLP